MATADAKGAADADGVAGTDETPAAGATPRGLNGLRTITTGVPGRPVQMGDLSATLEEVGPGPLSAIENGPALNPRPWTERLSIRLVVENTGDGTAEVWIRGNYPEVVDEKGHLRPPLDGDAKINARGLARDDSGLRDFGALEPGGKVTIMQSFEIRVDDHDRTLYVSHRVTPEALVRFRLW